MTDLDWMQKAISIAKNGGTPYGAVLVDTNGNFQEAYNTTSTDGPHAHAELNVIQQIHRLSFSSPIELKLYSTVEPCPMCMSALIWAGIGHLIYGASISDAAQFGHQIDIKSRKIASKAWYPIEITSGMCRNTCIQLF
ncbi:nucleoside deaminase [Psychroflexus sp. ALD_RP9]|uniref:nucleoside deaminase n=1 Tax=Psychroflexus sp. ALD_RP9 TaxID=2777186 RepID=UPI001A90059F|nr:nucleoside deaminase [Psychroflexus sp. ALD_RP9]QSS96952.1 nucleoside deaminase [Psychroflexus sp. ALD_RP9]